MSKSQLRSYPAACRTVMPSVVHCTDQYANNRAEVSHQPTRQRERTFLVQTLVDENALWRGSRHFPLRLARSDPTYTMDTEP